ncbi:hypothetical protein Ahy_B05g075055 [Arachis hypogaea]|uniref:DUF4283 domain-containing protein n=1 Tax=Arachis hypogaea TaxID=3818 RepID=A0A444Z0F5_ARAHY|nr:hypothetical protein Ahy_B05g075055 [Arachis hypogaea]
MIEKEDIQGGNVALNTSSCVVVKGGRRHVVGTKMEEDEEDIIELAKEGATEIQDQHMKGIEKSQNHEIKVKCVKGIFNFFINEAAVKTLKHPWWNKLIVTLLERRISLPVFTRRLETIGNRRLHRRVGAVVWTGHRRIDNVVGRTLKVDANTTSRTREKFARLCVELDLTEPLISQYSINGVKYKVEYEGLHNICFLYGVVDHEKVNCSINKVYEKSQSDAAMVEKEGGYTTENNNERNGGGDKGNAGISKNDRGKGVMEEENSVYGPWMMVKEQYTAKELRRIKKKKVVEERGKRAKRMCLEAMVRGINFLQDANEEANDANKDKAPNQKIMENVFRQQPTDPMRQSQPKTNPMV